MTSDPLSEFDKSAQKDVLSVERWLAERELEQFIPGPLDKLNRVDVRKLDVAQKRLEQAEGMV